MRSEKTMDAKETATADRTMPAQESSAAGIQARLRSMSEDEQLIKDVAAGAVGGLAGGLVMTAFMLTATKVGVIDSPLPLRFDRWMLGNVGLTERPRSAMEQARSQSEHLAFSAVLGAGFGALRSKAALPAFPTGPLYGLGVYAVDLIGLFPALGLTKGPWNEPKTTVGRRVMMHVVFGVVTALVSEQLRKRLG